MRGPTFFAPDLRVEVGEGENNQVLELLAHGGGQAAHHLGVLGGDVLEEQGEEIGTRIGGARVGEHGGVDEAFTEGRKRGKRISGKEAFLLQNHFLTSQ